MFPGYNPEHLPYLLEEDTLYDTSLGESVGTLNQLKGLKVLGLVYPDRSMNQVYALAQVPKCRKVSAKQLIGLPKLITDGLINESL